jgi:CheY-like chemotaxis protein
VETALAALSRSVRERTAIHCAFVDVSQNGASRLDLVRKIRANPAYAELQIIGLILNPADEKDESFARAGVNAFLLMPLRRKRLDRCSRPIISTARFTGHKDIEPPESDASLPLGKILVADDNEVNQKVVNAVLHKAGVYRRHCIRRKSGGEGVGGDPISGHFNGLSNARHGRV